MTRLIRQCSSQGETVENVLLTLEDKTVDINFLTERRRTALHLAVLHGNVPVVRLLLNHPNIDVDIVDFDGRTPLKIACTLFYNPDMVQELLQNPKVQQHINRWYEDDWSILGTAKSILGTIVHYIVRYPAYFRTQYIDIFKILLDVPGIDVNQQDNMGTTVLHHCTAEIVPYLLDNTSSTRGQRRWLTPLNPNITDLYGNTALMTAAMQRRSDYVMLLLCDPRVNCNIANTLLGYSPLHRIVSTFPYIVLDTMLSRPDIDVLSFCQNRSALMLACVADEDRLQKVKRLIQYNPLTLNQANVRAETVLTMASELIDNLSVIQYLVGLPGIDVAHRTSEYSSALHIVYQRGDVESAYAILSTGRTRWEESNVVADFFRAGVSSKQTQIQVLMWVYPPAEPFPVAVQALIDVGWPITIARDAAAAVLLRLQPVRHFYTDWDGLLKHVPVREIGTIIKNYADPNPLDYN